MNPNKAIALEKANMTKAYLLYDSELTKESGELVILGYFTLAIKNFVFGETLSNGKRKKLLGMSSVDTEGVPGYLIGQLAKNSELADRVTESINLHILMQEVFEKIESVQKIIGGRFAFLDCKKTNLKVHELYVKEGFADYQDIVGHDGVEYTQMVRLIK